MRGHVEESAEVTAMRALRGAARRFSAAHLTDDFARMNSEESKLAAAAVAYAEALKPKKRART